MEEQISWLTKTFKRADSNLRGKLKPIYLKHYPHYTVPGYNLNRLTCVDDWDMDNIMQLYQEFPYSCDFPKPLLPPVKAPRTVLSEEDPALQLVTIKEYMRNDIDRIVEHYQRYKKEYGKCHKKDIKWLKESNKSSCIAPKYIADVAEIIERDPDPYFNERYNWYYTGGALMNIHFNGQRILIFPYVEELIAAPMIAMDNALWKPLLQSSSKCELNASLYELRHSFSGSMCRILGRFKNQCNLYILSQSAGHLTLYEAEKQSFKVPLVSIDLNECNKDQYCTVNAERFITLWDITKRKQISSNKILAKSEQSDPWGSIRFQMSDPHTLLFTDRCCLYYLDTRLPIDEPILTLCPKQQLEDCDSLSVTALSRHKSCCYIGTYHNFLLCDNRSPTQCIQQQWKHQLKNTPLLACVSNRNDKEIVVLSSQIAGESTIIINTWSNDETSHSFSLPLTPPSIMETLSKCQMQGMCLDPSLKSRFELCNVGSTLMKDDAGNVYFFLQNSIGDIFYQCITHEDPLDSYALVNCKSYSALNAWEDALLAQKPTVVPLTLSHKINMQHIFEHFTNKNLRLSNHERQNKDDIEYSWKQSLEKLGSYVDLLAPELLSVWDVSEEISLPLTAAPHQKVLSWLESSDTKEQQPSQDESECILTPVNTQELISVSQEPDITCIDDSNALQELLLPKVKMKSLKKKRKIFP